MSINLDNLLKSIDKLELAIKDAESRIVSSRNQKKYAIRFDSYRQICEMQRRFSQDLFYLKKLNNTTEIIRKVQLINGLSAMILDDIRNITEQINLKKKNGKADTTEQKVAVN